MIPTLERYIGDEDQMLIWWFRNGSLIDFSVPGYTYQAKLAPWLDRSTIVFTKTTGFTGAAGSGTETSGTPNLTVSFSTSGELNAVTTEGPYFFQIVATDASNAQTTLEMRLYMKSRI
jgi:hypothetical protein